MAKGMICPLAEGVGRVVQRRSRKWSFADWRLSARLLGKADIDSKLVQHSFTGGLGGSIKNEWADDGLIITLRICRSQLTSLRSRQRRGASVILRTEGTS